MQIPRLSRRVLARLAEIEACESNLHYRDDLRIARLTVAYATNGEAVLCSPHVLASYMVLGLHPEKVWPAILARRAALGRGLESQVSGAPPVPKKPAQAVQLWFEKTNAARATNLGGGETLLRDNTISVPMAAPSIAALYRNPEAPSSAKTRQFTLRGMLDFVHWSGAPTSVKAATFAALLARGPWPKQDGPITTEICVSLWGMMLDGSCCRRTAQRRAKRACELGFWRRTRDLNSWLPCPKCSSERKSATCPKCGHRGRSRNLAEFRRPFTYEINVEKFERAPRPREIRSVDWRTYAEYKAAAKRGEHPNMTEMPRKAAQPEAQQPEPAKSSPPADANRSNDERRPLNVTRDVRIAIAGCYSNARKHGQDEATAIRETCKALSSDTRYLDESEVRLQLKIWQQKHGSLDPPAPRPAVESPRCKQCGTQLDWNKGPGPRLVCPSGCTSS